MTYPLRILGNCNVAAFNSRHNNVVEKSGRSISADRGMGELYGERNVSQ
jgi:hypothetical protein